MLSVNRHTNIHRTNIQTYKHTYIPTYIHTNTVHTLYIHTYIQTNRERGETRGRPKYIAELHTGQYTVEVCETVQFSGRYWFVKGTG